MVNDGIGACDCVAFPLLRFIRGVGGNGVGVVVVAVVAVVALGVCFGCCGSSRDEWWFCFTIVSSARIRC